MAIKTFENLTASMVKEGKNICWSTNTKDTIIRFCAVTGLCAYGLNNSLIRELMVRIGFNSADKEVYKTLLGKLIGFIKRNVSASSLKPALTTTKKGSSLRMAPYVVQWKRYAVEWASNHATADLLKNHDPPASATKEDLEVGLEVEFPWISQAMLIESVTEDVFAEEDRPVFLPAKASTTNAMDAPSTPFPTVPADNKRSLSALMSSRWAPSSAQAVDFGAQTAALANQQEALNVQQAALTAAQAQLEADSAALTARETMFHAAESKRRQTSYLDPLLNNLSRALGHDDSGTLVQHLEHDAVGTAEQLGEWVMAGQEAEGVVEDLEKTIEGLRDEVGRVDELEAENERMRAELETLKKQIVREHRAPEMAEVGLPSLGRFTRLSKRRDGKKAEQARETVLP